MQTGCCAIPIESPTSDISEFLTGFSINKPDQYKGNLAGHRSTIDESSCRKKNGLEWGVKTSGVSERQREKNIAIDCMDETGRTKSHGNRNKKPRTKLGSFQSEFVCLVRI